MTSQFNHASSSVLAEVDEYAALRYDPIPLWPGTKKPIYDEWQRLAPAVQWAGAPVGANIGLRGGGVGQAAYIDADEKNQPGTVANVVRYMAGLGYMPDGDFPLVQTASQGGRHIYVCYTGPVSGSSKNLRRDVGMGEFRYGPGTYVVAPPSVVDGSEYRLVEGDLRQVPTLDLTDIRKIVDFETASSARAPFMPAPSESAHHRIPRLAKRILTGHNATIGCYLTRSEAEYAAIVKLVNAGFGFGAILELFLRHPAAGKFAELHRQSEANALRWFRLSYDKAQAWAFTHESAEREAAREVMVWALSRSWPGRTGNSNRAVFLAHATIAYTAGKPIFAAPVRRLAELAGVSYATAQKANLRILDEGLVTLVASSAGTESALYRLAVQLNGQTYITSPQGGVWGDAVPPGSLGADAFRYHGLGKSAQEIWTWLKMAPELTVKNLANNSGRHVKTVQRALKRMVEVGLVIADDDGWQVLDKDLDDIAFAVGTAGTGARQHAQHIVQRDAWSSIVKQARADAASGSSGDTPSETEKLVCMDDHDIHASVGQD